MGMLVIVKHWGDFQDKIINRMELNPEENLVVCFPTDTGR
jgi:hypothetical protein